MSLQDRVDSVQKTLSRLEGARNLLKQEKSALELRKEEQNTVRDLDRQVHTLLEVFVKSTEISVREYIEPLVTEALDFVFAQGLRFHLVFMSRRNQVEVDFLVIRDDDSESKFQKYIIDQTKYQKQLEQLIKESRNINFMYGGAVNQVLSVVLRLLIVELLQVKGPIFFDEPSSAVSGEFDARLGQLISSLSKRFNRQIVFITHSRTLASCADKTYQVDKVNGVSKIEEIE